MRPPEANALTIPVGASAEIVTNCSPVLEKSLADFVSTWLCCCWELRSDEHIHILIKYYLLFCCLTVHQRTSWYSIVPSSKVKLTICFSNVNVTEINSMEVWNKIVPWKGILAYLVIKFGRNTDEILLLLLITCANSNFSSGLKILESM